MYPFSSIKCRIAIRIFTHILFLCNMSWIPDSHFGCNSYELRADGSTCHVDMRDRRHACTTLTSSSGSTINLFKIWNACVGMASVIFGVQHMDVPNVNMKRNNSRIKWTGHRSHDVEAARNIVETHVIDRANTGKSGTKTTKSRDNRLRPHEANC